MSIEQVLMCLQAAVLLIVIVLYVLPYWFPKLPAPPEPTAYLRDETPRPKGPYPKPSGLRTPKVNDEQAAWRKENDL